MLTLSHPSSYEFNGLVEPNYGRFDRDFMGRNSLPGVGYIRAKYINSAFAPIALNSIGILNKTYGITNDDDLAPYLEDMESQYNNISNTRLGILRIYTQDVDRVFNALDSDLYVNPGNAVQELYNKCVDQTRLRMTIVDEKHCKVKLTRGKHIVVLITDLDDPDQASDMFLTLGLTPILFPDWKEKFNEEEIEYFKVLVNRSQVKRISNVKAIEAFNKMVAVEKYTELLKDMRLAAAVENVVAQRIRNANSTLYDTESKCSRLMEQYNVERSKYYTALSTLRNLEETREQTLEEIRLAIRIEGIIDVRQSNDYITMCFKTPVKFYNTDEVECVLNGLSRDSIVYRFFKDVFLDEKYQLMIYNEFMFSFNQDHRFQEPREIGAEILNRNDAMFNPHTYFFGCLGDYKPQLIDAQAKQDLLLFNNIALASTKSINFRDGAVINRWKSLLDSAIHQSNYTTNLLLDSKCLIDEDGNKHSIREVYMQVAGTIEVEEL